MIGRRIVILGSGDIGLIMARRMTLEGAKVLACVELMPYSSGLNRNIVQCLHDFNIPLFLSHTITDIEGDARLQSVTVSKVGADRMPVAGTERKLECDTLLLSVGLIPENELSRQAGILIDRRTNGPVVFENMETSIPGIFACGNVVHVHDLVDFVTEEAIKAGRSAAETVLGRRTGSDIANVIELMNGDHVTYTVPQRIRPSNAETGADVSFRVNRSFGGSRIVVSDGEKKIASFSRSHMTPGEMEHISIPRSLLDMVQTGRITVSCEEASA